jgi:hypothetical protein
MYVLDEATISLAYKFTTGVIHWKLLFSFYQLQMCVKAFQAKFRIVLLRCFPMGTKFHSVASHH